jgi:outer membrane receptor for ferrienterochelin and colicin
MNHLAAVALLCSVVAVAQGGTNGTIEGTVKAKGTGEALPGATVILVGTQRGATTDSEGRFVIANIRAGNYDVRVAHVGHQSLLTRNVAVVPDLRTRLLIELEPADVMLEEVVVTLEKPLLQRDVTGTTYVLGGDEAALLPMENAVDALRTRPGVTPEGNVRGGKTTEVLYLVDGLPVQDVVGGGNSATLPNSSITDVSIYTGGFEAEYGNALSGVVNIVSRTGNDAYHFFARGDKDNLFRGYQNNRTNDFELSSSGPLVTGKLHYLAAVNAVLTDTRWWQDFQYFFPSPVDRTISGFAKIDYLLTPTMHLSAQVLLADRKWRDYEFDWRFNLDGLPRERRTSYRIAAVISHTPSERFSYTASISRYYLQSRIGDGPKERVVLNDPYQYDFFLRYVVDGQRTWWSNTTQESYAIKGDGTLSMGSNQTVKFGAELTLYHLNSDLLRYEPRRTYFGKPLVNEPQLDFSSSYAYRPRSGALYVQAKSDLPDEGVLLTYGLRYEVLDPTAERPRIEALVLADTAFGFGLRETIPASVKQQLSPRLGAAMQIAERGYLFVNIGWYFQYPLFNYLYTGLDRVALAKGLSAVTGNPDLEPERTKQWEISLRYVLPLEMVGCMTYFKKETTNLVDTKTFIPGDSKLAGSYGFAEYVNNPYAQAEGLELLLSRPRGSWLTGEFSYTYTTTEGVSGSANDGFYIAQYGLPPAKRSYPLSWDQRHSVKCVVNFTLGGGLTVHSILDWHTGRPYTYYPTSTGFTKVDTILFAQNNARMPASLTLDVRAQQQFHIPWWSEALVTMYVDCRNLTNELNVLWIDSNGRIGGELSDPSGYATGRRTNLGMQIEF